MNIKWTLAGHTDTKQLNNGSYEIVALKTYMAIFNDINVILCIGENLKDREAGKTSEVTAR
jgi:triosephosphate isomerase